MCSTWGRPHGSDRATVRHEAAVAECERLETGLRQAQAAVTDAEKAAQAAGGIVYGIYPTASVSEVEFQMRDGGASIFIAEDQEYVDKILQVADRLQLALRVHGVR